MPLTVGCEPRAPQAELGEGFLGCEKTGGSCRVTESTPRAASASAPLTIPRHHLGSCSAAPWGWGGAFPVQQGGEMLVVSSLGPAQAGDGEAPGT